MKKNLNFLTFLPVIFLGLCIFFVFYPLTKTFYQQDEWLGYGSFLSRGIQFIFLNSHNVLDFVLGEGRVLSALLYYFFFKFFPFNATPIAIFSIVFHILNTTLAFFLIKKIFKKTLPAFFGSLFFAFNSVSQEAVTWPATIIGTLPSTALIILSLFTFIEFLEKKRGKWLVLTFLLLYVSLFFKETAIFLFLYLPIASLLFERFNLKKFLSTYWPFVGFFLVDTIFRVSELRTADLQQTLFLGGSAPFYWQTLLTRAVLYPLTSFSLTFVPSEPFLWFARSLTKIYYPFIMPQQFILFAQTAVLDLLSTCLTFLILTITFILFKFSNRLENRYIKFFIGFLFFSFLPYILISKNYAYLESRYYYLPSLAGGIILAWLLMKIIGIISKTKIYFLRPLVVIIFVLFLLCHLKYLEKSILSGVAIAKERISFLLQLNKFIPKLEKDKNIFYIDSDADSYVPGNKAPFQQGMGYTLMTIYYKGGKIPRDFLMKGYLFEIASQGYEEEGNCGFGYFSKLDSLKEAVKTNNLPKEVIIGLFYDSKTGKLLDITQEVWLEI